MEIRAQCSVDVASHSAKHCIRWHRGCLTRLNCPVACGSARESVEPAKSFSKLKHIGGQVMKALEVRIPPPVMTILVAVIMWIAANLLPTFHIGGQWRLIFTVLLAVLALVLGGMAFVAFGKSNTTIDPIHPEKASSLVSSGVYRFTRNPMYVALGSLLMSWAVWLSVPWVVLGPAGFIYFTTRLQIMPEERALSFKFGRTYDDYCLQVPRWL